MADPGIGEDRLSSIEPSSQPPSPTNVIKVVRDTENTDAPRSAKSTIVTSVEPKGESGLPDASKIPAKATILTDVRVFSERSFSSIDPVRARVIVQSPNKNSRRWLTKASEEAEPQI